MWGFWSGMCGKEAHPDWGNVYETIQPLLGQYHTKLAPGMSVMSWCQRTETRLSDHLFCWRFCLRGFPVCHLSTVSSDLVHLLLLCKVKYYFWEYCSSSSDPGFDFRMNWKAVQWVKVDVLKQFLSDIGINDMQIFLMLLHFFYRAGESQFIYLISSLHIIAWMGVSNEWTLIGLVQTHTLSSQLGWE